MPSTNLFGMFDLLARNHWGKSIEDLRKLPLMTPEKLAYFSQHSDRISKLVSKGVSLEQLLAMQLDKFKKLIDLSAYKIDKILTFVTMNQILGVDHVAPPGPQEEKNESDDNMRYIGGFGGGSSGDYTYEHSDHNVNISFKKKWTCVYESGPLKEEYAQQFEQVASKQPEEKLLHRWIQILIKVEDEKEDSIVRRFYYSPDNKKIVKEEIEIILPIFIDRMHRNVHLR
jgi:hypothetical protein